MTQTFGKHVKTNTVDKIKLKTDKLPRKHFAFRNSLLTDIFEDTQIKNAYDIFLLVCLGHAVHTFLHELIQFNTINFGQTLFLSSFKNFHVALIIWFGTFLLHLLCYPGFSLWAVGHCKLISRARERYMWDCIWIIATILYYFGVLLYFPTQMMWQKEIVMCSALITGIECFRLIMKSHAFIRHNSPKILSYKPHNESELPIPKFSKFLYFSFAPTLVYQDEYPRTKVIRWKQVIIHFTNCLVACLFLSIIAEPFLDHFVEIICIKKVCWSDIVLSILRHSWRGILLVFLVFHILQHSWLNAFAEILRFGDRLFYKDWWTSASIPRYYRTWNNVVHDWLYTYIYKDCCEIFFPKNRIIAKVLVIIVSALAHELLVFLCLRMFFPIMFITLVIPSIISWSFREVDNWALNMLFLYAFGTGVGTHIIIYILEFTARKNCSQSLDQDEWTSYLIPQSIQCNCITYA